MEAEPQYLFLNSRDELLRIDIQNIVYFEADGNYTNIISVNKLKGVVCVNLAQMQKLLSERLLEKANIFARVGKKYIVNLNNPGAAPPDGAHPYSLDVLAFKGTYGAAAHRRPPAKSPILPGSGPREVLPEIGRAHV